MYESEYKKVWEKDTPKLEEYDFFLRSNFYFMQYTPESLDEATRIIREGLVKYPGSSLLSCGLAWDNVLPAIFAFDSKQEEHWKRAYEIVSVTLAKPNLGPDARKSCLWSSMYVHAHRGDFEAAIKAAEEVAALSPGDAYLICDLSNAYRWSGKMEKALELTDYALKSDPANADYYLPAKANIFTDLERYTESAELISKSALPQPLLSAINYMHMGKAAEAKKQIAKVLAQQPWLTAARWRDMTFNVNPALMDRQVADLVAAGLPEK